MSKINWVFQDEQGTNLNRYKATNVSSGEVVIFDLLRNGSISVVGTPLNASNLNSLISAINDNYDLLTKNEYTLSKEKNVISLNRSNNTNTKVTLTKSDLDLGNVDNTSDENKPISKAMQQALEGKVANTNKVNGYTLDKDITLTKSDVGLGNVNNTSDLDKPISTQTQAELNRIDGSLNGLEENKLNSNLGSNNSSKYLYVDTNGNVGTKSLKLSIVSGNIKLSPSGSPTDFIAHFSFSITSSYTISSLSQFAGWLGNLIGCNSINKLFQVSGVMKPIASSNYTTHIIIGVYADSSSSITVVYANDTSSSATYLTRTYDSSSISNATATFNNYPIVS